MRIRRSVFLCGFVVVLLAVNVQAAVAAAYSVVASDPVTADSAYGTTGSNYTMSNPSITYFHLNSIYIESWKNGYQDMAEVGWIWTVTQGVPRYFWAYTYHDYYYGGVNGQLASPMPGQGTNHAYKVSAPYPGSTKMYWNVDGQNIRNYALLDITNAHSLASSERNSIGDSNYGHWWALKSKRSGNVYLSWQDTALWWDNDPSYWLVPVSATEVYMQM